MIEIFSARQDSFRDLWFACSNYSTKPTGLPTSLMQYFIYEPRPKQIAS